MNCLFKIFNVAAFGLIVLGGIVWGLWGFFHVEVLAVFFGPGTAKVLYCVIGVLSVYGVHLFIDYARKTWRF